MFLFVLSFQILSISLNFSHFKCIRYTHAYTHVYKKCNRKRSRYKSVSLVINMTFALTKYFLAAICTCKSGSRWRIKNGPEQREILDDILKTIQGCHEERQDFINRESKYTRRTTYIGRQSARVRSTSGDIPRPTNGNLTLSTVSRSIFERPFDRRR